MALVQGFTPVILVQGSTLITGPQVCVCSLCPTLCHLMDCSPPGFCPWNFPGKNTGVGCHFLLQENLPSPGIGCASPTVEGRFFKAPRMCNIRQCCRYLIILSIFWYYKFCLGYFFFTLIDFCSIWGASLWCLNSLERLC